MKAPVHVRVDSPIDLRKEILKTAVSCNMVLQKYEDFREVGALKEIKFTRLITINNSISKLLGQLRDDIPELEKEHKIIPSTPEQKAYAKKHKKIATKKSAEGSLEKELREIETKLNSL